jgi:hypothetical protein
MEKVEHERATDQAGAKGIAVRVYDDSLANDIVDYRVRRFR